MLFPSHIRKLSYASTIRGNECLCLIQGLFPTSIELCYSKVLVSDMLIPEAISGVSASWCHGTRPET